MPQICKRLSNENFGFNLPHNSKSLSGFDFMGNLFMVMQCAGKSFVESGLWNWAIVLPSLFCRFYWWSHPTSGSVFWYFKCHESLNCCDMGVKYKGIMDLQPSQAEQSQHKFFRCCKFSYVVSVFSSTQPNLSENPPLYRTLQLLGNVWNPSYQYIAENNCLTLYITLQWMYPGSFVCALFRHSIR